MTPPPTAVIKLKIITPKKLYLALMAKSAPDILNATSPIVSLIIKIHFFSKFVYLYNFIENAITKTIIKATAGYEVSNVKR